MFSEIYLYLISDIANGVCSYVINNGEIFMSPLRNCYNQILNPCKIHTSYLCRCCEKSKNLID